MAVQVVDGMVEVRRVLVAKESLVVKGSLVEPKGSLVEPKGSLVEPKGSLEGCQEHQEGHGK